MPKKETVRRARKKKREGKAPTTQAGEFVREEMHHIRKGKHGARSTKQAIAIGLSKARNGGEQETKGAQVNMKRAKDDYQEMTKTWKHGYLQNLDACLQGQAENKRLIKDTVKQGLSGSRQFLSWWKDWIEGQAQRQAEIQRDSQRQASHDRPANNVTNPLLGFTKQSTEAILATVEPLLKYSEAAVEMSFGYYENAVATLSRKYVRAINEQVLDAVIPS